MSRFSTLLRGGLLAAPSLASAHHGGCFPTVTHCQPHCTPCYTPCHRPLVYSQPLFYAQPCVRPIVVQPCVRPIIVTPYINSGYRVIVR